MKLLGVYRKNKIYLLPLIMLAAVFFTFQGLSLPDYPNPQESRLSIPQQAKPSTSAVLKNLLQTPQAKITKTPQLLVLFSNELQFKPPVVQNSIPQHEPHSIISAVVSTTPARAPPA